MLYAYVSDTGRAGSRHVYMHVTDMNIQHSGIGRHTMLCYIYML